jgi:hypothetical protein
MHLCVEHHPRLIDQHRRLVGRAATAAVLELEQPRLGLAHHHGLGVGTIAQRGTGALKFLVRRRAFGGFTPLRFQRFALDQGKARTHRFEHRSIARHSGTPGVRALEHGFGHRSEQGTAQRLLMARDEAPQDRMVRGDPPAHPHALQIAARQPLQPAQ